MIIKRGTPKDRDKLVGIAILLIGVIIGALLTGPSGTMRKFLPGADEHGKLSPVLIRGKAKDPAATNNLPTVRIDLGPEAAAALQRLRDEAMKQIVVTAKSKPWLPATITVGDKTLDARVRLKGDVTDHVDTDKWSLRIQIQKGSVLGMRVFSIQHPKTRGFLQEWLLFEAARLEGLLAPRTTFVNVVINDNANGVYLLSEHFAKELLESQGRREGPIVGFTEDAYWLTMLRHHALLQKTDPVPGTSAPALGPLRAVGRGFDEARLAKVATLNRQLQTALGKMRDYIDLMHVADNPEGAYSSFRSLVRLQGRTIDRVFDTDRVALAHAVLSLFGGNHGLVWHNQRYYHNPLTSRLEPILFDCVADPRFTDFDLAVFSSEARAFARSPRYYRRFFAHMSALTEPGYISDLEAAVRAKLASYEKALISEELLPPGQHAAALFSRLRTRQAYFHKAIHPRLPAMFECWVSDSDGDERGEPMITVSAWTTTRIPVQIHEFRFENGVRLDARRVVAETDAPEWRGDQGEVILPPDGERVTFRLKADQRLAGLHDVREIKRSIRSGASRDRTYNQRLFVRHQAIPSAAVSERPLYIRKGDPRSAGGPGRPAPVSLSDALRKHRFLRLDTESRRLVIAPGRWVVDGDLVIPHRMPLYAGPGVVLEFNEGTVFVTTGPTIFRGTAEEPVTLRPAEGVSTWAGIAALDPRAESTWEYVAVHKTAGIDRQGWSLTGGTTLYRAPCSLRHVGFHGSMAEDALNAIGGRLALDAVSITGSASDAFDGDFVSGHATNCSFVATGGDALDLSGSLFAAAGCRFSKIGDKALSLGEETRATVSDCRVDGALVGVAAKDASTVAVDRLTVSGIRSFVLAAYQKKSEYGPASITASGVVSRDDTTPKNLAQTGSQVVIDGRNVPTADIDVDGMYRDGLLGN